MDYYPVGLTGDPLRGCSHTDECNQFNNPCGANAICRNTNPGFVCECPPGKKKCLRFTLWDR